jgi:hypothetical protein
MHPLLWNWLSSIILLLGATLALRADEPLPEPWKHQDIGAGEVPGTTSYAPTTNHIADVFTLQGALDLWGPADGCHFVYQPRLANFELVARVTAIDNPGGVAHAKASVCVRESLDPGARNVTLCVTPSDGTQFLYREVKDGKTARVPADAETAKTAVPKGQFPCWLKLVRVGNDFTGYESADGTKWVLTGKITLPLPNETLVGLAASSHRKDVLTKVIFDHVASGLIVGSQF